MSNHEHNDGWDEETYDILSGVVVRRRDGVCARRYAVELKVGRVRLRDDVDGARRVLLLVFERRGRRHRRRRRRRRCLAGCGGGLGG